MTYRVIKKIKGRCYLYEQETYRKDGKVHTRSWYIAPIDPVVAERVKQTGERIEDVLEEMENPPLDPFESQEYQDPSPTQKTAQIEPEKAEPEPILLKPGKLKVNTTNKLLIKANLAKHKISQEAVEKEYQYFLRHLADLGLKTGQIKPITIGYGRAQYQTKSNGYRVNVPRFRRTETIKALEKEPDRRTRSGKKKLKVWNAPRQRIQVEFRREYRKALARIYLDEIELQDPVYFEGLKKGLSKYYKKQNRAIFTYLLISKRSDIINLGYGLHYLYSKMVAGWTKAHLSPEKIGFVDFSHRRNWQEDTASLMADIQMDGYSKCYKKYMDALKKVETQQKYAIKHYGGMAFVDRLSGKRRAQRETIRKLNARRRAVFETCNKISLLAPLFQGYNDHFQRVPDSFLHEQNWNATKMQWKHDLGFSKEKLKNFL